MKIVTGGNNNNTKALSSSSLPLLPDESMLGPDLCSSSATISPAVTLAPIDAGMPMPAATLTDVEECEAEFCEFLVDAVDWL